MIEVINNILNSQYTRILLIVIVVLCFVALFIGKMSDTIVASIIIPLATAYIGKRVNEKYQDRKNAEMVRTE